MKNCNATKYKSWKFSKVPVLKVETLYFNALKKVTHGEVDIDHRRRALRGCNLRLRLQFVYSGRNMLMMFSSNMSLIPIPNHTKCSNTAKTMHLNVLVLFLIHINQRSIQRSVELQFFKSRQKVGYIVSAVSLYSTGIGIGVSGVSGRSVCSKKSKNIEQVFSF